MNEADWKSLVDEILVEIEPTDEAARAELHRQFAADFVLARRLAQDMDRLAVKRKLRDMILSER
jgi:hypothetical protein